MSNTKMCVCIACFNDLISKHFNSFHRLMKTKTLREMEDCEMDLHLHSTFLVI